MSQSLSSSSYQVRVESKKGNSTLPPAGGRENGPPVSEPRYRNDDMCTSFTLTTPELPIQSTEHRQGAYAQHRIIISREMFPE